MQNALRKQELRARVLREHYKLNEEYPGTHANAGLVGGRLNLDLREVILAGLYLMDKGLLKPSEDGVITETGNPAVVEYFARITDTGIDFVEDPTDWGGRNLPSGLVYILAGGNVTGVTVAGRDVHAS